MKRTGPLPGDIVDGILEVTEVLLNRTCEPGPISGWLVLERTCLFVESCSQTGVKRAHALQCKGNTEEVDLAKQNVSYALSVEAGGSPYARQ